MNPLESPSCFESKLLHLLSLLCFFSLLFLLFFFFYLL
jgi:hypothetical protein